ncbi:cell wall-associated NlpC family hydrolase [Promicromonospora sp. AC04]|uniref:C40 family peptidase n=1 Tax=Promicromonospora sp. AC04 TaxID=2135723 RepID=UPI000D49B089|nr:NlpC/P60 family protein [Promicromonospora sp. AC04]PUB28898.1 cell wall-associated NlpC family hydrolase [Promicromonospora sp. AC04]
MTNSIRGRHRDSRPAMTPLTILARTATENAGTVARRGALAAAAGGVLISTIATTAHAAPAMDLKTDVKTAKLNSVDLNSLTAAAKQAVAAAPTVTVPADAKMPIEMEVLGTSSGADGEKGEGPAVVSVDAPDPVPVGQQAVNIAFNYLGITYVLGGASPSAGFDCSGLIQYVYAQLGVGLPHQSGALLGSGYQVTYPEPGDIVWTPGHVALYAGDGMIIEAWAAGMPVRYTEMWQNSPTFIRVV